MTPIAQGSPIGGVPEWVAGYPPRSLSVTIFVTYVGNFVSQTPAFPLAKKLSQTVGYAVGLLTLA